MNVAEDGINGTTRMLPDWSPIVLLYFLEHGPPLHHLFAG
jgi:hypothetical protein